MRNQRGEVVTGVMVVIMVVMMLFGGMHMMHRGHQSEGDHGQVEQKHDHDKGVQHKHDNVDERAADPAPAEGK
jgi:high-affinity Fe2+/Pb2+ permease